MEGILHQLIGSLSQNLPWVFYIPGGFLAGFPSTIPWSPSSSIEGKTPSCSCTSRCQNDPCPACGKNGLGVGTVSQGETEETAKLHWSLHETPKSVVSKKNPSYCRFILKKTNLDDLEYNFCWGYFQFCGESFGKCRLI